VIFRAKRLFNGKIYSIGHVQHAQGKNIKIVSAPPMPLETDGELQGETPVIISVVPHAIKVVVTEESLQQNCNK
jgi:diacylglycerol kinase family enzyme